MSPATFQELFFATNDNWCYWQQGKDEAKAWTSNDDYAGMLRRRRSKGAKRRARGEERGYSTKRAAAPKAHTRDPVAAAPGDVAAAAAADVAAAGGDTAPGDVAAAGGDAAAGDVAAAGGDAAAGDVAAAGGSDHAGEEGSASGECEHSLHSTLCP